MSGAFSILWKFTSVLLEALNVSLQSTLRDLFPVHKLSAS